MSAEPGKAWNVIYQNEVLNSTSKWLFLKCSQHKITCVHSVEHIHLNSVQYKLQSLKKCSLLILWKSALTFILRSCSHPKKGTGWRQTEQSKKDQDVAAWVSTTSSPQAIRHQTSAKKITVHNLAFTSHLTNSEKVPKNTNVMRVGRKKWKTTTLGWGKLNQTRVTESRVQP